MFIVYDDVNRNIRYFAVCTITIRTVPPAKINHEYSPVLCVFPCDYCVQRARCMCHIFTWWRDIYREYFMESAGVRYLSTSCWRIRKSERSERVRFLIQKQRVRKYVQSTFHEVLCLLYTYWDIHHFGGLFILNLSKMLKFAATHLPQNDNENEVSAF